MKKIYLCLSLMFVAFTSCFEDEGNYKYKEIGDIKIEGMDKPLQVYSYVGDKLEIHPSIETPYTNLEYAWYIWHVDDRGYISEDDKKKIEKELVGTDKNLSYEVNLIPGMYKIMLEVTSKENGYSVSQVADVEISTTFLRGFYILKETEDGNSKLDLHYQDGEPVLDVLSATNQDAIPGKPLALDIVYGQGYLMDGEFETGTCNAVCVTTQDKVINFFSTKDMSKILDNSRVVYGGLEPSEVPYRAVHKGYSNFLISSRGITVSYNADMMPSTGSYATQNGNGGSVYAMQCPVNGMAVMYWNQEKQRIDYADAIWMSLPLGDFNENGFSTEGMECLMCGACTSTVPNHGYFLLKDADGKKYLYEVDTNNVTTLDRIELDALSKVANATCYATNQLTASYLYYIYDNKLYAYNLTERSEEENPLTLEGLPEGETITYLSYQWLNCAADKETGYNFTHLMVGTQNGNTYRVYMYDLAASVPKKLVRVVEGQGILKSVAYVSSRFDANSSDDASF